MNRFSSMFSQILQLFPRLEFQDEVRKVQAERHARGFSSWAQFVSMLFCQLGRAHSLREISGGLRCCEGKLKHLGITAPNKSTLAYANHHRPWELYEGVFMRLLARCQAQVAGRRKKFRFKNRLVSLDSSVIDVCLSAFDWAKFRRTKGAIKLHLLLDHDGYLPSFAVITEGKVADVRVAQTLHIEPGTIIVDDRGYNDFGLFGKWTAQGVYFVTRMKERTRYKLVHRWVVPERGNVLKDQIIRLTGQTAEQKCPHLLRRVVFYDPLQDRTLVFLTNHMDLGSTTIAAIYKDRWQIELFFKALKQNLKIKTFVGTSANAVKTQIWTALIAMLLLRYLQLRSRFPWSLSNLVALLRLNLFTHRDLWAWMDAPFQISPYPDEHEQLQLAFA